MTEVTAGASKPVLGQVSPAVHEPSARPLCHWKDVPFISTSTLFIWVAVTG